MIRTYSTTREDIFNIRVKELPEYSVIYKMLYKSEFKDAYTKKVTLLTDTSLDQMGHEKVRQAAKFQVEFYFGQTNYHRDLHLRDLEGYECWINLNRINAFFKMRQFQLPTAELYEIM